MNRQSLFSIVIITLLITTVIPTTGLSEINPPADRGDGIYENAGDWTIEIGDTITHEDRTIVINGDLTILGSLTLTRCQLVMNMSDSTILVEGELYLEETNISGSESSEYFFIVNGKLDHWDSNLFDISGTTVNPFIGGLQIYSEDVHIDGGSIQSAVFTGIYITTDITIWNLSVTNNVYNVVMNGSSPDFMNCTIRYPGSVNLFMVNGSTPTIIGGVQAGEIKFHDEDSSLSYGHSLHVHVAFENGTSIPGVSVTASSQSVAFDTSTQTDENGWVRNMVLPEYTRYKTIEDKVYTPYRITVEKFGLVVMEVIQLNGETTLEVVLAGDYFGEGLSRGDYNGDGNIDLAVGVPRNRTGTDTHGAVFVFLNKGGLELSEITEQDADLTIRGEEGIDFGTIMASGDINGDGFDDLLIGTPLSGDNGPESGMVRFFFGGSDPSWDDLNDADLTFNGDPGDHYGTQLLVTDLNNDPYQDFIIGDRRNTFVYFSTATPGDDFTLVSEVNAVAGAKGKHDTTGQSLSKILTDDDDRYKVSHPNDPNNILHITDFTFGDVVGEVTSATMWFQFTTDQYYGYNSHERNYMYYNVGDGWKQSIRPRHDQQNWRNEQTWSFDLFADGVTSMEQLSQLQVYLANIDGTNNSQANNNIYFDFISVEASFVPKGANHTLLAGNVSTGDVNGDGYRDIIISDPSEQIVYFNGPLGISAPEVLQMDLRFGDSSNVRVMSGDLVLSETRPYLNGQFDDGWDGWQQTANSLGQKDGGTRWSIIDQEDGDWKVHEGPTGGFGSDQDSIGGGGWGGLDCRGMLRTADFLVTDDMETVHFWYQFKAQSFERAGGNQGSTADQIRYRIFSADNDSVLMELAGWTPTDTSEGHEEQGMADANISVLRGEMVYIGFEIITNRGNSDRAIAQIDNLTILPKSDIPYYSTGSLESDWIEFEGNISSLTPSWVQDVTGGTISVKFRTDNSTSWGNISDYTSGVQYIEDETSSTLQYRIEMAGDGTGTPRMSDLSLAILLEGQIIPLPLETGFGTLSLADMNGDGYDDILFLDEGSGQRRDQGSGVGIDLFYGIEHMSRDYDPADIVNLFTGDVTAISVLDLEIDGTDELCLVGDTIRIIDGNADTLWEQDSVADRISGDVAGDPSHQLSTGSVYFVPSHDLDVRILGIEVPDLVDPDQLRSINISVGNVGTQDVFGMTLSIDITADGYDFSDTRQVQLDSMERADFEFFWDVPEEEGIVYTINVTMPLLNDRLPENNEMVRDVTSKEHIIVLSSDGPVQSAHGGDELIFQVTIDNIGTFESENVTLDQLLPVNWIGSFRMGDEVIDWIIVMDTINISFHTVSPPEEENDNFTINLSGMAETALAYLDLTAIVLRPDLIVEEIRLVRADGVITNDTLHGVAGDAETLDVLIRNQGPTYSTGAGISLSIGGELYDEFDFDRLEPGESRWFSTDVVPEAGDLEVYVEVDPNSGVVYEEDESNNDLGITFSIKSTDPVGPYTISGVISNIFGDPVSFADVSYEWGANRETNLTNENGNFSLTLDALSFYDGQILHFNGTDGENVTSVQVLLYSEDGGVHLLLTLNQYLIQIEGPDTVSTIDPDGTIMIELEVTNMGNINSTFVIEASEIPDGWSVAFPGIIDNTLVLSIEETVRVIVEITSSPDPLLSVGHNKYFVTVFVFADIFPAANDSFSHGIDVNPSQMLVFTTDGANTTSALPGEPVVFDFIVENLGNEGTTYIPQLIGGPVGAYEFSVTYVPIDINGFASFSLTLILPHLESGSVIVYEVGSSDEFVTNAEIRVTALDLYGVTCTYPDDLSAAPGDSLSIPLAITNTGNLEANITVHAESSASGVSISDSIVTISMLDQYIHQLQVTLPDEALSGSAIILDVTLSTDGPASLQFELPIAILEFRDITLTLEDTIIDPQPDFTIYRYEVEATNAGNGMNTFYFRVEGTHPGFMSLPAPLTLGPGEIRTITTSIIVPHNRTGVIDNYLIPTDETGDYEDLNFRILSYTPHLETGIHIRQEGTVYNYDITVTNNGKRFERFGIELELPQVSEGYGFGDRRWEGQVNRGFLEVYPGEMKQFTVRITTPEKREYWGSDMKVVLHSSSGKTENLPLHKPPIAILGANLPDTVTFEDSITFTGSQSYWNILEYHWDFGDGQTGTGSSIGHAFGRSGVHYITLTVVDEAGLTASDEIVIEIGNIGPNPVIRTNPVNRTVEKGMPIELDGSFSQDRDGEIVTYLWEFGEYNDFFEGIWPVIEHSYQVPGVYTITLHITDNGGMTTNTTVDVTVTEKSTSSVTPKPVIEKKTTIDPMTYIPVVLLVLILIAGVILVLQKRMFVDHLVWKIHHADRKVKKKL
jgi:uncharacterized membrane protein